MVSKSVGRSKLFSNVDCVVFYNNNSNSMELLNDPIFKTKYQKYKLRVKIWESNFMEKYGRKPNKNDIKEADTPIREAYKMYWKLKTRALEESLTDITFCDDVETNQDPVTLNETKERNERTTETMIKDTENIDVCNIQSSGETVREPNKEGDSMNINCVWGSHLSKSNEVLPKKKQALLVGRSSSFQLSQNKLSNCSFTKRNPRKSLSTNKLKPSVEKALNDTSNISIAEAEMESKDSFDMTAEPKTIFDKTINVVYAKPKFNAQSVNTVRQLIDAPVISVNRNLNQGWLDRCAKENHVDLAMYNTDQCSNTNDSGIESMESSIHSPKVFTLASKTLQASDEEDYVRNSDSEEEHRNKRIRNFKKRLSDQECHVSKKQCTDVDSRMSYSQPLPEKTSIFCSNPTAKANTSNYDTLTFVGNTSSTVTPILTDDITMHDKMTPSTAHFFNRHTNDKSVNVPNITSSNVKRTNCVYPASENEVVKNNDNTVDKNKAVESTNSDTTFDNIDQTHSEVKKRRTQKNRTVKDVNSDELGNKNSKRKRTDSIPRRSGRKKKVESIADIPNEPTEEISHHDNIPIYGIEIIDTIPRYALNNTGAGDLVVDFSKSLPKNSQMCETVNVKTKKTQKSDKEKLEQKIASGKINDNYVRINIKKKVFVRGKKSFNFAKYKKHQWKERKKELASSESNLDVADLMEKNGGACFKCGNTGHFARKCPNVKSDELIPLDEIDESSQYPTLEEAEKMASQNAVAAHGSRLHCLPPRASQMLIIDTPNSAEMTEANLPNDVDFTEPFESVHGIQGHKVPMELINRLMPPKLDAVKPLYSVNQDNSLIETPPDVLEALQLFGHTTFRSGQEKAIMRILSGQSTLVTLTTGSGKSLCYQLPAYLYSKHSFCITLVISPLVSLMDDQVTGVPSFLSAACLHTNQTPKVRDNVMQMVKQGKVNILLVSPEAVVAGEKSTGFGALLRQLPPIAFACIDEAHCISQWSDNFRPSYLMVCRVLREKMHVKTVLGLTATATKATAESIVEYLNIYDGMAGVISDVPVPRNLCLTASKDENRDHSLINLLQSERFEKCDSIIIYCTRREECARIAGLLRISLQKSNKIGKTNANISPIAEAYHAGLTSYRRKSVQKAFMNGNIRIVVATVAFGMGINKSNIRSVIHYNMPGTFEGYVQEIGRAGRDGNSAQCHLFLNPMENSDKWELRRHINANGVDRHTIRRLLQNVFVPCSCKQIATRTGQARCPGHEVAIPIDETVQALDITAETISTLLCYLELHPKRYITVLSSAYVTAKVSSYNGPAALKQAAQSSPPLAMAIALDLQKGISHENSTIIEFPVVDIASAIGWDSGVVKSHLKNLEWKLVDGKPKRTVISVRYDTLGLRIKAPGNLNEAELDEALDTLVARTQRQETCRLLQLETIYSTLQKFSTPSIKQCSVITEEITHKSEEIKTVIRDYFNSDRSVSDINLKVEVEKRNELQIADDVRSLVLTYTDNNFTGRAVARIFHGIQSPNYPALAWSKCRFWRAHLETDFNAICQIATKEILALR